MWEKYDLLERIGEGGMGAVFRAYDKEHRVTYAAKRLKSDLDREKDRLRFVREVTVLSQLSHENIVRIVDIAEPPEQLGYIMEYCPDGDLVGWAGLNEPGGVVSAIRQLVNAVAYLHGLGSGLLSWCFRV
jgi:serine/threonine protein kinase